MSVAESEATTVWTAEDIARAAEATGPSHADDLAKVARRGLFRLQTQRAALAVSVILVFATAVGSSVPNNGFLRSALAFTWVFVWLGIATLFAGRTMPMRLLVGYFVMGFFAIPILTVAIAGPIVGLIGDEVGTAIAVPLIEEGLKVVPVLVLALSTRKDAFGLRSLVDYLFAGFAVGAGFMLREDLLWERNLLNAEAPLALIMPWGYSSAGVSSVHPGWTALIAFGIGLLVVFRGRWFTWIPATVVIVLPLLEHIGWNSSGLARTVAMSWGGTLVSGLLLLCLLAALGQGLLVRHWGDAHDSVFPRVAMMALPPWKASWHRAADYNRKRTQAHLAAWQRDALGVAVRPRPAAAALLTVAVREVSAER